MPGDCVLRTDIVGLPVHRGKVRDVYDGGDHVLLVATDRLSAFDWVLPTGIPDKGRVLTQTSAFWFGLLDTAHHFVTADVHAMDLPDQVDRSLFAGRTMFCRKSRVIPYECVARGYLSGSAWKEYQATGEVCGIQLPEGLVESERLPEPIFTPATKAEEGHDENVSYGRMAKDLGTELAEELRRRTLALYRTGAERALTCGIVIADTKFEFGFAGDELLLIDEVMTPDSSRFWPANQYAPGRPQNSFDKQFVRDWLSATDWDKNSEPPPLPEEVAAKTREKYVEAYERLTGERFGPLAIQA